MIDFVWLIPVVMGLAALVNGLGCRKLGKVAGYISVAAMISTFVLALAIFFQVKGLAHHDGGEHGSNHGVEEVHLGDEGVDLNDGTLGISMGRWQAMNEEQQAATKSAYTFVRAQDLEHPQPWETSVRGGLGGYVPLWQWIDIPNPFQGEKPLKVEMAFYVDQLTIIYLLFVSFVGSLVFIYATGYMKEKHNGKEELDPGYARFFSYLALFAMSMYILVLGANMVVMFIGWEGVGLCSYLLIGYYYDRQFSEKLTCADAGMKAFVVNRIGDFGLIVGMGLLFWGFGTLDFQELITAMTMGTIPDGFQYSGILITAAMILLFLGATGKSAQIPLFVWLPDAMAGPTPVSALIHAATMVTAGIYMLARLNVMFMMAPMALLVVALIGTATAFVAAYVGLTQRGIKKILAYSTVSQLGYMFMAIGVGSFAAGIFHVFTHAFFKGCLFLAAGSIIHSLHHEEDVFKMGGLKSKMPKTCIAYFAATLAIAGIFPFAGFFSKDEILYMTFTAGQGNPLYMALWVIGVITAALTAFYMGRSLFLAFFGKPRMSKEKYDHVHESPLSMTSVLLILAVCSLLVGALNVPTAFGGSAWFHHFLAPVTDRGAMFIAQEFYGFTGGQAPSGALIVGEVMKDGVLDIGYHGPEVLLAIMSVLIGLGGLGLAYVLYGKGDLTKSRFLSNKVKPLWNISSNGWWWDNICTEVFVKGGVIVYTAVLWFDQTVVDGAVNGAGMLCRKMSNELRRLQNGQVQVYGLLMIVGVCIFLLYFTLGLTTFLKDVKVITGDEAVSGQSSVNISLTVDGEMLSKTNH
jgi:NADH-quinone oxidoreductase subunit L